MEKRRSYRTAMTLDFTGEILLDGQTYASLPVHDVGLHGCCLRLPVVASPRLRDQAPIERMLLSWSGNGPSTLKARVVWHDLPSLGGGHWVKTGVEFLEVPEACERELRERVAEGLACREP